MIQVLLRAKKQCYLNALLHAILTITAIRHSSFLAPSDYQVFNPSRSNPGRRENIKALKAFIKFFEAPQRSVKIKI